MSRRVRVRAAALWVRAQAAVAAEADVAIEAAILICDPFSAVVGKVVGTRAHLAPPRGASAPPLRRKMPS